MADLEPDPPDEHRIDFGGLRRDIETAVILPEFRTVARRARRRRTRSRATTVGTLLLIAGILGPAGVVADLSQASVNGWVAPPDQRQIEPSPGPSSAPAPEVDVAAVAGVDLEHTYALVDVCVADTCDLQLSRLAKSPATATSRPLRSNLLRATPTAWLDSVGLTALSDSSFRASGLTDSDQWKYEPIDLVPPNDLPQATSQTPAPSTGDRMVQLTRYGKVQAVQARTGQILQLPTQPPLSSPTVVTNQVPTNGAWVIGVSDAGQLAVSVSRDAGISWTTVSLDVPAAQLSSFDQPVFASNDGKAAYLLLRKANEDFVLFSTADGGHTWQRHTGALPWPQPVPVGAAYGLVVRPDRSLLAWLNSSPTITYLDSTDAGNHFRGYTMPNLTGPVYAVPSGYVQLGAQPAVSSDGVNWARRWINYTVPGS